MARLAITVQNILPGYPTTLPLTANSADFVWTTAGAAFADGASFPLTGKEILLIRNDNAGAQTVTITSVADKYGRSGDITAYSVGISEYAIMPIFPTAGWEQTTGLLHFAASAADVFFAVLRMP